MQRRNLLKNGLLGVLTIPFLSVKANNHMSTQSLEQLLLQRYPGIRRNLRQSIWEKVEHVDLRKMPNDMNSIAWNIWHMARAEDVGMNRLVTNGKQVFDQGDYRTKLNIGIRHFGTGMTTKEVQELSNNIDLTTLREYHEKVGEQTLKVFQQLENIPLDEKLDKDRLNQVMIGEGVLHENALWVESFYETKIRSWFLVHMGLTHSFEHLGQIMVIRKLLGYKGTR